MTLAQHIEQLEVQMTIGQMMPDELDIPVLVCKLLALWQAQQAIAATRLDH